MTITREVHQVESFEGFVESALPRLVRFASWVAGPSGDPEDLVQDALIRVGSRWSSIASRPGDPEAYTRRAIVNGHVSRWRSRRREHLVEAVPDGTVAATFGDAGHGQVWRAVQSLPRGQRAVIALRFFEDMTIEETARVLGVTPSTVKTQSQRALSTLHRELSTGPGDERGVLAIARSRAHGSELVAVPGASQRVADGVESYRRRRGAAVTAGITAAALALVAAAVVWSPWGSPDRFVPVVPAPSVQKSPSPVPTSQETQLPDPTATSGPAPSSPAAFPANTDVDTGDAVGSPVLFTDVRIGRQDGFDRVVWEFAGDGVPGWRAKYTDDPRREGSGDPVDLPGDATLAVLISGVGYPDAVDVPSGTTPYAGARRLASADTELVTEVLAGSNFEGYQDSFVGVTSQTPFRVYRLENPTRIVLEVRAG